MLEKNLSSIKEKLQKEKEQNPKLICPNIIAVSKKQPIDKIKDIYSLGQRHFGENYLQEALEKMVELSHLNICWHFIGSLQTKKLKEIVGRFDFIHSVSREKEIQKIIKLASEKSLTQKIFLQVNIGNEDSKSGFLAEEIASICLDYKGSSDIDIVGLMFFPPIGKNSEEDSLWFKKSFYLFSQIKENMPPSFNRLSMGTSQNYEVAYREGATDLRIGETLFGERI